MRGGDFEVTERPVPRALLRLPGRGAAVPAAEVAAAGVTGLAVFGYASLVSPASAAQTLGRPVGRAVPARLHGWARGWTLGREQAKSEKTFARPDGSVPALLPRPQPRARRRTRRRRTAS